MFDLFSAYKLPRCPRARAAVHWESRAKRCEAERHVRMQLEKTHCMLGQDRQIMCEMPAHEVKCHAWSMGHALMQTLGMKRPEVANQST